MPPFFSPLLFKKTQIQLHSLKTTTLTINLSLFNILPLLKGGPKRWKWTEIILKSDKLIFNVVVFKLCNCIRVFLKSKGEKKGGITYWLTLVYWYGVCMRKTFGEICWIGYVDFFFKFGDSNDLQKLSFYTSSLQMLKTNEMDVLRNVVCKTKINRIRSQQIRESYGIQPINE